MNFIALDFETANYSHDSTISIGLVKFENGTKTECGLRDWLDGSLPIVTCQKIILLAAEKHGCKTLDDLLKCCNQELQVIQEK